VVGDVVAVVEDLEKLPFGLGVVGVGAGLVGNGRFGRSAEDQHGAAAVLHRVIERPERDGVVDFVGAVAVLDV
jgi:hypothetical protein